MSLLLEMVSKWMKNPRTRYARRTYSQEGEDMILQRIFGERREGFYVDVGAHQPFRYSNTYVFYKKGWRGINIDGAPGSMAEFQRYRSGDINIEAVVSSVSEPLDFYVFDDQAYNTSSKTQVEHALQQGAKLIKQHRLESRSLKKILDKHLPDSTQIDFMSVDVEGFDLEVLKSNDWKRYRPKFLLVECMNEALLLNGDDATCSYLAGQGYALFGKTVNTAFFQLKDDKVSQK